MYFEISFWMLFGKKNKRGDCGLIEEFYENLVVKRYNMVDNGVVEIKNDDIFLSE